MLTYINCIIIFNILALNDPSTPFIDSPPFGYSTFSQNHKISISHLDGLFIFLQFKGTVHPYRSHSSTSKHNTIIIKLWVIIYLIAQLCDGEIIGEFGELTAIHQCFTY